MGTAYDSNTKSDARKVEFENITVRVKRIFRMSKGNNASFSFNGLRITSSHWPKEVGKNYRIVRNASKRPKLEFTV